MEFVVETVAETKVIVGKILKNLDSFNKNGQACIISLNGELGAGKTTLVKIIARLLGIKNNVASPTFTIMRRYDIAHGRYRFLYHIDAYRIENIDQIKKLGIDEIFKDSTNLAMVEWGERIASSFPAEPFFIKMEIIKNGKRKITAKIKSSHERKK